MDGIGCETYIGYSRTPERGFRLDWVYLFGIIMVALVWVIYFESQSIKKIWLVSILSFLMVFLALAQPVSGENVTPINDGEICKDYRTYLKDIAGDNFDLINRIVIAESGWRPNAKNAKSTASGLGQFLDSTFKSQCINKYGLTDSMANKNDPYVQLECMVKMIEAGGQGHWSASQHNW